MMKRKEYVKPLAEIVSALAEDGILVQSRWNVHDGNGAQGTPGDPDNPLVIVKGEDPDEIFSKRTNVWDGWDGWED